MEALKKKINISNHQAALTKQIRKPLFYNAVKDNTLLKANVNFMCDLLFLPTTSKGFKYCFVIVDLATNEFDIEPIKNKEPNNILTALKAVSKRSYIKIHPDTGQSIRTDSGTEFQGIFHKYLYDNSILQRVARPNRHIQLANVERLNGILGNLFNGYMTSKEEETQKQYNNWTDIVDIIRKDLNKIRNKKLPSNIFTYEYPTWNGELQSPKYKVGDLVNVILESPEDRLGNKFNNKFRMGDYRLAREPKKITQIFYYHGSPFYRYAVNSYDNVSFQESELRLAKEETHEKFRIKKIIGKRKLNNKIEYLIWWQNYLKKDSTWESEDKLKEDELTDFINDFNKNN